MLCALYCNYKYSCFFFKEEKGHYWALTALLSVCRENKGFVSRPWTQPDGSTPIFPSKVGFLPLASCSGAHACAGENLFHLISGVGISDTRYFSQGLFLCDSTFGVLFSLLHQLGNSDLLLQCRDAAPVILPGRWVWELFSERWWQTSCDSGQRSPALPWNKGMRLPEDRVKGLSQGCWGRSWLPSHLPDSPDESRSSQTCHLLFSQRFWTPIVSPRNLRQAFLLTFGGTGCKVLDRVFPCFCFFRIISWIHCPDFLTTLPCSWDPVKSTDH